MFCLLCELDTFSITATSSRAARRSGIPTAGVSSSLSLVALYTSTCTVQYSTVQYSIVQYLYMSPISPSRPFILSDQVKLCIVASSLVSNIWRRRLS